MKLPAVLIVLGVLLIVLGCASDYIAADKNIANMTADELRRELAK